MKNKYWKITKVVCLVVTTIALLYDVVIAIASKGTATLSQVTLWTAIRWAGLPFIWGGLTSHFFMGKLGRFLFGRIPRLRFAIWIPVTCVYLVTISVLAVKSSPIAIWLGVNLWLPLLLGEVVGLLWWQKRPEVK